MRADKIISVFTNAYGLLRPDALLQIRLFRRAYVFAYFQYKKFFEDPFLRLAQAQPQLFRDGDILDIGANIGYTASVFAGAIKIGSNVFAFEPDRLTYDVLSEVVQRKKLDGKIEAINIAVGSSDGEVAFWHNKKHPADHRVVTQRFRELDHVGSENDRFSTIPVTRVDTFVANRRLQNLSFIKIDVQGYELAVCEGMRKTLERFPDLCVCLEYCPNAMSELGFEPQSLLDFFHARGYQVYALGQGNPKLLHDEAAVRDSLKNIAYVDLLFTKRALPTSARPSD
jgi:FkbM family methyltransferase